MPRTRYRFRLDAQTLTTEDTASRRRPLKLSTKGVLDRLAWCDVVPFDGGLFAEAEDRPADQLRTIGRLLCVRIHEADIQDRDGAKLPLKASRRCYPFVTRVFADGDYAGRLITWAADKTHINLEIIRRGTRAKGFELLPRRWLVERTFAWTFKNRCLVRDYTQISTIAETFIIVAASATNPRRCYEKIAFSNAL